MKLARTSLFDILLVLTSLAHQVSGHGRLMEPVQRGSMWRRGYTSAPANYDDMSNYCGGIARQWNVNKGKCGVCGVSSTPLIVASSSFVCECVCVAFFH